MTESEWLSCDDPRAMLAHLQDSGKLSERKARLFAVACCRCIWHLIQSEPSRRVVVVTEQYADWEATGEQLARARKAADPKFPWLSAPARAAAGHPRCDLFDADLPCAAYAGYAVALPLVDHPVHQVCTAAASAIAHWTAKRAAKKHFENVWRDAHHQTAAAQCGLLRDLFGNPFRPSPLLPPPLSVCTGGLVVALAQAAYDERHLPSGHLDPARLRVLADALEEAGCTDAALLAHLREPGPHWRGCWAVDAVLGRA